MVDFQSKFRMYGYGYNYPEIKTSVAFRREMNHEMAKILFKRSPKVYFLPNAHDCRMEVMKDHMDKRDWETWLLSHGLSATYKSVEKLHCKEDEEEIPIKKLPDKLITAIGLRGSGDGDFIYPRGLTVNLDGDIIVADTGNHRLQVFSNFGVLKYKIGTKGLGQIQFDEPTGVTELPNGDIAVADKNNKRIQVLTDKYAFKYAFQTCYNPYCVASDREYNIIVSTVRRTIEVYCRSGKLLHTFSVGSRERVQSGFQICVNDKDEVIVSDPMEGLIKFYNYQGQLLYKFEPQSNCEGLSVISTGICTTQLDHIIVADSLNHTVNIYTERGILLQQLLCPTDDAGSIQALALGPEGHMVVTEYSISGQHCIKIFRYRPCQCHASRPGSSKRRTPNPIV